MITNSMEGSDHFKATKGGELFKGKLTRCKTAKANLTKSLTAFQKNIEDYVEAETQPIVTKKRKANAVIEGAQKMESRLEKLAADNGGIHSLCVWAGRGCF